MTRINTRKGDDGTTGLGGGQRVAKDALRVATYGTVDELNSVIGLALASGLVPRLSEALPIIQNELFHLGSDLCFLEDDKVAFKIPQIETRHVEALERLMDDLNEIVGPIENFVLPGGTPGAAHLHVARTVCRRAERRVISLRDDTANATLVYLNRLSDYLFVAARYANAKHGVADVPWRT